jgi:transcriptional antiterminator RfaH
MDVEKTFEAPSWYVIQTKPKQETRADSNLTAWNIETFNPKIKEWRRNNFTGKFTLVVKSLFTNYIFARFRPDSLLHKVCFTRGVHRVVSFGDVPKAIDDEIIALIHSREDADGFVRTADEFVEGDQVIVKDGPLKDFVGVFQKEMKATERVVILLSTVSYQAHMQIEKERIRKL